MMSSYVNMDMHIPWRLCIGQRTTFSPLPPLCWGIGSLGRYWAAHSRLASPQASRWPLSASHLTAEKLELLTHGTDKPSCQSHWQCLYVCVFLCLCSHVCAGECAHVRRKIQRYWRKHCWGFRAEWAQLGTQSCCCYYYISEHWTNGDYSPKSHFI